MRNGRHLVIADILTHVKAFSMIATNLGNQTTEHKGKEIMKERNLIDIIERFQTHHALQEEREINNFHVPANGAVASNVQDKDEMPNEAKAAVIAPARSPIRLTK